EAEGACLASSEYLLCGLPVVSTPSRGGRDIWYDEDNSMICEPSPAAVHRAVRLMIERSNRGELDPQTIREKHIERAQRHRARFLEITTRAFKQVAAIDDPTQVFERTMNSPGILPLYRSYTELSDMLAPR